MNWMKGEVRGEDAVLNVKYVKLFVYIYIYIYYSKSLENAILESIHVCSRRTKTCCFSVSYCDVLSQSKNRFFFLFYAKKDLCVYYYEMSHQNKSSEEA